MLDKKCSKSASYNQSHFFETDKLVLNIYMGLSCTSKMPLNSIKPYTFELLKYRKVLYHTFR